MAWVGGLEAEPRRRRLEANVDFGQALMRSLEKGGGLTFASSNRVSIWSKRRKKKSATYRFAIDSRYALVRSLS